MSSAQAESPKRPVWLFSLDTEQFSFLPLVTAGLKSYFERFGETSDTTEIELVHMRYHSDAARWVEHSWVVGGRERATAASGHCRPVIGLSCYTWNLSTLLSLAAQIREDCPSVLVVAGGPHVQQPDELLREGIIDVVVLGEGEVTFTEILDHDPQRDWADIDGVAFRMGERIRYTTPRSRERNLDRFPSPLEAVTATDLTGRPLRWAAYETMRGCPYSCSFCEWGTGALGEKGAHHSPERVQEDLDGLVALGVEGILFCDSNFGAFSDDAIKAEALIKLKHSHGKPVHFATCWSRTHGPRSQRIAEKLARAGLLEHYTIALQTLTPRALQLSDRVNPPNFAETAGNLLGAGVPVVSELIWGLPGDTLSEFEANVDELTCVFPSHTIYPYALLPGTDMAARREELEIETMVLSPYGKTSAEYIVASLSFDRSEGLMGYDTVTSQVVFNRGGIIPLTIRYLALEGAVSVSRLLRQILEDTLESYGSVHLHNSAVVFEKREFLYRYLLSHRQSAFAVIRRSIRNALAEADAHELIAHTETTLKLDEVLCPRRGEPGPEEVELPAASREVLAALQMMQLPDISAIEAQDLQTTTVQHDWDFGYDLVPRTRAGDREGLLYGRYPVWP